MPRVVRFENEKRVRGWIRDRANNAMWIEPTRGSTIGVPDAFVLDAGGIFLELKRGECADRRLLRWKARPGQYWAARTLRDGGILYGFVVGVNRGLFVTSDPEVVRNNWAEIREEDLIQAQDPEAWKKIVAKIVRDCYAT